jgi:hypothetical protein
MSTRRYDDEGRGYRQIDGESGVDIVEIPG